MSSETCPIWKSCEDEFSFSLSFTISPHATLSFSYICLTPFSNTGIERLSMDHLHDDLRLSLAHSWMFFSIWDFEMFYRTAEQQLFKAKSTWHPLNRCWSQCQLLDYVSSIVFISVDNRHIVSVSIFMNSILLNSVAHVASDCQLSLKMNNSLQSLWLCNHC